MRYVKLLVLVAAALVLAANHARAQESTKAQKSDPLEGNAGIPNYYRLRPDVAAAGQPSDEALGDIQKAGFKVVVNFRTPQEGSLTEGPKVTALGMKYYNIPIGTEGLTQEHVELFSKIMGDSQNRPVFIHCAVANRVGAMWFIHEVLDEGKDEATALAEARRAGLKSLEDRAKEYVATHKPK